jgi:hypothetical protein
MPAGGFSIDFRCFGGFLVILNRDVFCVWWSTDATPPTKRERNGFWLIGSYKKWAQSKFS